MSPYDARGEDGMVVRSTRSTTPAIAHTSKRGETTEADGRCATRVFTRTVFLCHRGDGRHRSTNCTRSYHSPPWSCPGAHSPPPVAVQSTWLWQASLDTGTAG